jgi:hypothetical protein
MAKHPKVLSCLWTDGEVQLIDLYQVTYVYAIFDIDRPVAFWRKKEAKRALDEIHRHIHLVAGGLTPDVSLDVSMQYHIRKIPMPALAFLVEKLHG